MNSNKLSTACLLLLILSTSVPFNTRALASDISDIKPSIQQAALQKLSKKVNAPIDKLEIVYTFKPTFRTIGKAGFGFVVVDKRNGKIFDIAVDSNGQEINIEKLAQQDRNAYLSKYGKLSQGLFEKIADTKPNDEISVVIKLKVERQLQFAVRSSQFAIKTNSEGLYPSLFGCHQPAVWWGLVSPKAINQLAIPIRIFNCELRLANCELLGQDVKSIQAPVPVTTDTQQQTIENEQVVNEAINKIEELGFNVNGDNSSPAVYGNLTPTQIRAIEKLDIVDSIDTL